MRRKVPHLAPLHRRGGWSFGETAGGGCRVEGGVVVKIRTGGRVYDRIQVRPSAQSLDVSGAEAAARWYGGGDGRREGCWRRTGQHGAVSRASGTARGTAGVNEPAAIKSNAFVVGDDAPPPRLGSAQTSVCGHRDDDDEDNEEDEVDGDYYHYHHYYHRY